MSRLLAVYVKQQSPPPPKLDLTESYHCKRLWNGKKALEARSNTFKLVDVLLKLIIVAIFSCLFMVNATISSISASLLSSCVSSLRYSERLLMPAATRFCHWRYGDIVCLSPRSQRPRSCRVRYEAGQNLNRTSQIVRLGTQPLRYRTFFRDLPYLPLLPLNVRHTHQKAKNKRQWCHRCWW